MKKIFLTFTFVALISLITESTFAAAAICGGFVSTIVGTAGNDTLDGTSGPDVISGLAGNDIINGFDGNDIICGGPGSDTLNGDNGDDLLFGKRGSDTLNGGDGKDNLKGGFGNDTLAGGPDDDNLNGGPGVDNLNGDTGVDSCNEDGSDTISNCEPSGGTAGCANCPCDFFSVPMTVECWESPIFLPKAISGAIPVCALQPFAFFGFALAIIPKTQCITLEGNGCCVIYPYEQLSGDCATPVGVVESLNSDQVEDCRTCLEEYATELNNGGITVTGGPPYVCVGP